MYSGILTNSETALRITPERVPMQYAELRKTQPGTIRIGQSAIDVVLEPGQILAGVELDFPPTIRGEGVGGMNADRPEWGSNILAQGRAQRRNVA